MTEELSLDDWLSSTIEKRAALLAYASSKLPTDPGERQLDVSESLENSQDAGDLLADAEMYLSQAFAREILAARQDNDASTAKIVAKGAIARVERLRDGLQVIYSTIKARNFSLMNLNRTI